MAAISRAWYNGSYTKAAKPIKCLELHSCWENSDFLFPSMPVSVALTEQHIILSFACLEAGQYLKTPNRRQFGELQETLFSNSSTIHQEKTKKITTVTVVWICDPNYHKILPTLALNFSKNYCSFEKPYQTLESVFHQISKHLEVASPRFFNLLLSVWISNETLLASSCLKYCFKLNIYTVFLCSPATISVLLKKKKAKEEKLM